MRYIVRVERFEDVFAVKFYAKRDRKLDTKYHRIIKAHGYATSLRIFVTCASIIPEILKEYPNASFAVNGARSMDLKSNKIESENSTQRFRIYRAISLMLFGRQTFEHVQFAEVSSYLLVNRKGCEDIEAKTQHIKNLFLSKFEFGL